jgi:hypothetical protein
MKVAKEVPGFEFWKYCKDNCKSEELRCTYIAYSSIHLLFGKNQHLNSLAVGNALKIVTFCF